MAFKNITANFEVVGYCYHYRFEIKRRESGAFNYGDHSCHTLDIYDYNKNGEWVADYLYDTRYDHISTQKEKWVKVWVDFIKREWVKVESVKLLDYEEEEVDEKDESK